LFFSAASFKVFPIDSAAEASSRDVDDRTDGPNFFLCFFQKSRETNKSGRCIVSKWKVVMFLGTCKQSDKSVPLLRRGCGCIRRRKADDASSSSSRRATGRPLSSRKPGDTTTQQQHPGSKRDGRPFQNPSLLVQLTAHPQDETERKTDRHQVRPSSSDSARCEKQSKENNHQNEHEKESRERDEKRNSIASAASEF
jgi:hypothetical protein